MDDPGAVRLCDQFPNIEVLASSKQGLGHDVDIGRSFGPASDTELDFLGEAANGFGGRGRYFEFFMVALGRSTALVYCLGVLQGFVDWFLLARFLRAI